MISWARRSIEFPRVVLRTDGTYLLPKGRDGLTIIDQHAAQERVKYEELRESISNDDQSQQQLLVPYIFEFPTVDALRLSEAAHEKRTKTRCA